MPIYLSKNENLNLKIFLLRVKKNIYNCAVNKKFSYIKNLNLVMSKKNEYLDIKKKKCVCKLIFHNNFLTNEV